MEPVTGRHDSWRLLQGVRNTRQMIKGDGLDFRGGAAPDSTKYLQSDEVEAFVIYQRKMLFPGSDQSEDLEFFAKATAQPVSGLISSMHGDLLRIDGKYEEALAAYERGAADGETGADSRRRALDLCLRRGWKDKLRNLYEQPGWREAVIGHGSRNGDSAREVVVAAGDWLGVLRLAGHDVLQRLKSPQWILMAAMTALLWFLVIHVGACVPVRLWWHGLLGFGCGLLSIPFTHFLSTVQEAWFGTPDQSRGLEDIIFCISGVGLPEELAKLVLFLPLLILLRKATAAHVLAVAASTGLGFAALENVGYFNDLTVSAVWARFITANFLHFALTGLTGLALWQAVRNPGKWLQHFTVVFVGAVIFHGLWDWTPTDQRLAGDYSFIMFALLVGLSLYFFRELLRYSQPKPGVPSAVFIYLAGGAVMLSVLLSLTTLQVGFRLALVATFQPVLALFVIGAAMYYQLRRA